MNFQGTKDALQRIWVTPNVSQLSQSVCAVVALFARPDEFRNKRFSVLVEGIELLQRKGAAEDNKSAECSRFWSSENRTNVRFVVLREVRTIQTLCLKYEL